MWSCFFRLWTSLALFLFVCWFAVYNYYYLALIIGCVRLASLGRPWSAPGTFEKLSSHSRGSTGSAPCALLVERVTLELARGARRHHERASAIVRLALVRGSPGWAPPRGRPREAKRTHPIILSKPMWKEVHSSFGIHTGMEKGYHFLFPSKMNIGSVTAVTLFKLYAYRDYSSLFGHNSQL